MRMLDLIAKKRDGGALTRGELAFVVRAASGLEPVPDYQLSAWLMAVCLRGMSKGETVALTGLMAESGKRLDLRGVRAKKVDKHSTGGVGDGISLALAPLVASAGLAVPMMSGRGLGHTGGTLDKLESIRGFRVALSGPAVAANIRGVGVCMFGQTGELSPADRKLYALRDATGTVGSLPLIVASILSKKLAEGLDALVLDIKCGSGAIFERPAQAERLGGELVRTAKGLGLPCAGLLTAMEQPLGRAIGNALELRQAVAVLGGDRSCPDYVELLLALGGWMLRLADAARDWREGAARLEGLLKDGTALARFRRMVRAQGGDARVADDPDRFLPKAKRGGVLRARRAGFVTRLDARLAGRSAVALGAGRDAMEDRLDYGAGILLEKKLGDPVRPGEIVARLYAEDRGKLAGGTRILESAVTVGPKAPRPVPLIRKVWR